MQPWLAWNSLCRQSWPPAQRSACLCLPKDSVQNSKLFSTSMVLPLSTALQTRIYTFRGRFWGFVWLCLVYQSSFLPDMMFHTYNPSLRPPGLHYEFQDSTGYRVRPCSQKKRGEGRQEEGNHYVPSLSLAQCLPFFVLFSTTLSPFLQVPSYMPQKYCLPPPVADIVIF